MDEWDEFLSRADTQDQEMHDVESKGEEMVMISRSPSIVSKNDLGEYEDNAEVLMQMARGESFNTLSSNGVWIKSDINSNIKSNSGFMGKKRTLKANGGLIPASVPIANSVQDLTRAITGHPTLSHPLSHVLLRQTSDFSQKAYEIDSLGLFFYGLTGDVKVEWSGKDDMMKIIEMKKRLIDQSIIRPDDINFDENFNEHFNSTPTSSTFDMKISQENLKLLAGSIPPYGKIGWMIPFTVTSNKVELTEKAVYKLDQLGLFFEYCDKFVFNRLDGLLEPTEHFIIERGDSLKVSVQTCSPHFNISVNFRGESYEDPTAILSNFLFYRQSNYLIEIDFESLKIKSIKSFLPKFDHQNRLFSLLKALKNKLTKLTDGKYFLSHQPNTPFIKILSLDGGNGNFNQIEILPNLK
jgi:hypothetical protein